MEDPYPFLTECRMLAEEAEAHPQEVDPNAPVDARLPSLDLFTGIGGNVLALKSGLRPVALCEIEPGAREILKTNMDRGNLERVRIYHDVKQIHEDAYLTADPPVALVASSPCQDLSCAGNRVGIEGERSKLFFEIPRILDEFPSIKLVFLENSSNIRTCGLETVLETLESRGFTCAWGCQFHAKDIGAPHGRKRFFLLGIRGGFTALEIPLMKAPPDEFARYDRVARLVPRGTPAAVRSYTARMARIGNATCPQQVCWAWNSLKGYLLFGQRGDIGRVKPPRPCPDQHLVFECTDGSGELVKPLWPTPVYSQNHGRPAQQYWGRYIQMLSNALFRESGTLAAYSIDCVVEAAKQWVPNPHFHETIMGFPRNWTSI